ncbi:MAG: phospho-N-acetylmuramoyl-pentapeptide-transferase [Erysipelotrichaceae bacterium]|nr:phospho-N-acetylmuramoyl-pentapeptide-transferase [Erysipelotrichaceae bacterium]MBR2827134.1 phospho-N-acetylmuramoyl-pentapeptide-transferase [Erysipelotrichaceae bacterium]MBR6957027.1 phospho-N-acetylmuramoyl-pentapeptide-transferase [Erysipelotrichaceae bacterium]
MLLAMILSLGITLASYPVAIPVLHKLKFGQTVREEGPESHKQKTGTPTMGGLVFIFSSIITSLLVNFNGIHSMGYLVVVLAFVGYGIIGFIDDYLIVVRKNNDGLKPSLKFLMQSILAVVFYLIYRNVTNSLVIVPFLNIYLDLGIFYVFVVFVMFTGESNAVNLTDGLDGLSAGLVVLAILPFIYFCVRIEQFDLGILLCAVVGSLIGYLRYNMHPAQIFMGDTGSLALGGLLAAVAMVTKEEIALILIGGVFVVEVVSVIIQVGYFKITHGKRFFRMAPIHHHFELGGMDEQKVVYLFWTVGAFLSLVGFMIGAFM